MTMQVYSDGMRIVGLESVIGYDMENPARYWFDGLAGDVYILTELMEFTEYQRNAYDSAAALIEDQPDFNGDTDYMTPEHMKRYIDKHFYSVPFSKGEHGISAYWIGASRGWDCGTAGFFLLPRNEWNAANANAFSIDCETLMECMTAWANGDEWATHEMTVKNGTIEDETCYGFYGKDDALSDACISGFNYIGEFEEYEDEKLFSALAKVFPDRFCFVEHVEHVPEKIQIIPAHDETCTEFVHVA